MVSRDERHDQKLIIVRNNNIDEVWNGNVKLGEITWTDVSGKQSLDVNVTDITLSANNDSIETRSLAMSNLIDEASSTITYIGEAVAGTSSSAGLWRIKKVLSSGASTQILFANGSGSFSNIWDNRAALTYT